VLIPWLAYLSACVMSAVILRKPLCYAMHATWFVPAPPDGPQPNRAPLAMRRAHRLPTEMYQVTSTFFTLRPPSPEVRRTALAASSRVPGEAAQGAQGAQLSNRPPEHSPRHLLDPPSSVMNSFFGSSIDEACEEDLCFVCFDVKPDAILYPCGHGGSCVKCACNIARRQQARCAICRQTVGAVLRITAGPYSAAEVDTSRGLGLLRAHRSARSVGVQPSAGGDTSDATTTGGNVAEKPLMRRFKKVRVEPVSMREITTGAAAAARRRR